MSVKGKSLSFSLRPIAASLAAMSCAASLPVSAAPGDALGPPFTVRDSSDPKQRDPSVASDAHGNFVVVFADEQSGQIIGRRYAADTSPLDGGFEISTSAITIAKRMPDVAMDAAGDFLVSWLERPQDGRFRAVARRYTTDGVAMGSVFPVETGAAEYEDGAPAVAMDDDGDAVIAWQRARSAKPLGIGIPLGDILEGLYTYIQAGSGQVVAQRYSRTGAPVGEAQVTARQPSLTVTSGFGGFFGPSFNVALQTRLDSTVDVAMDHDGDFALAWNSGSTTVANERLGYLLGFSQSIYGQSGRIHARRYRADGTAAGPARIVGSALNSVVGPSVTMAASGRTTVVWAQRLPRQDASGNYSAIYAQGLDTDASRSGPQIDVGRTGLYRPTRPSIAADAAGNFFVVWDSGVATVGRRYDASSMPRNAAFQIAPNGGTPFFMLVDPPAVASDPVGNIVAVWNHINGTYPGPYNYFVTARAYSGY